MSVSGEGHFIGLGTGFLLLFLNSMHFIIDCLVLTSTGSAEARVVNPPGIGGILSEFNSISRLPPDAAR